MKRQAAYDAIQATLRTHAESCAYRYGADCTCDTEICIQRDSCGQSVTDRLTTILDSLSLQIPVVSLVVAVIRIATLNAWRTGQ